MGQEQGSLRTRSQQQGKLEHCKQGAGQGEEGKGQLEGHLSEESPVSFAADGPARFPTSLGRQPCDGQHVHSKGKGRFRDDASFPQPK